MKRNILQMVLCIFILLFATNLQAGVIDKVKIEGIEHSVLKDILKDVGNDIAMKKFGKARLQHINQSFVIKYFDLIQTKERFILEIKDIVNSLKLWDKNEVYIWKNGNIEYPDPIIYYEIIDSEDKYIIYCKNKNDYIPKKYIDAIKYKKYYKGLLVYEEFEESKKDSKNILDLSAFINQKQ